MEKEKNNQSLTLNLKIKINPLHSDYLKKIIKILTEEELGEYFMRFLKRHTLNELNNKEDYLENWVFHLHKNLVSELAKEREILKSNIISSLIDDDEWLEKLK